MVTYKTHSPVFNSMRPEQMAEMLGYGSVNENLRISIQIALQFGTVQMAICQHGFIPIAICRQAITWSKGDQDQRRHMTLLDRNGLILASPNHFIWEYHMLPQQCSMCHLYLYGLFQLSTVILPSISHWLQPLYDDRYKTPKQGPVIRYVKCRVTHASGMPGTFSLPPTLKEIAS